MCWDGGGNTVQSYSYNSFGETKVFNGTGVEINASSMIQSPYGYTAREWDSETSQYYYRARYYDSRTGRFISADPIGFLAGDTNLYRYVSNNPTRFTDPSGLFCIDRFLDRYTAGNNQTKEALAFANTLFFAVASDVLKDYFNPSTTRSLNNLLSLMDKAGKKEWFRSIGTVIGPAVLKNIGMGLLEGIAVDYALEWGINTGSLIESLIGEFFNDDECEQDMCSAK